MHDDMKETGSVGSCDRCANSGITSNGKACSCGQPSVLPERRKACATCAGSKVTSGGKRCPDC